MDKYVCGLIFSVNKSDILLIRKDKPTWQSGLLNGIGGRIAVGENKVDTMIRKCKDETGLTDIHWRNFCRVEESMHHWRVDFYIAYSDKILDYIDKGLTSEEIEIHSVNEVLHTKALVSDLRWLIPMAIDSGKVSASVKQFDFNQGRG